MPALREAADRYLAIRRSLGYKLKIEGRMLGQFVDFCDARGLQHVTVAAAVAWATAPAGAAVSWWAARLTVIREFARFLVAFDERTEIPPTELLPRTGDDRIQPYLYSPTEIAAMLTAARGLAHPLRAVTFEALIGLMAATGIRTGEATGLDRVDADLAEGILTIRGTKLGKSRLVPLHATTVEHLVAYQHRRDRLCPRPATTAFFLSSTGTRLNSTSTSKAFARVLSGAGITVGAGTARPRLYDLRHLRGDHVDVLVRRRRRRRTPVTGVVDLPGTCQPRDDLLVSARLPTADDRGRQTVGSILEGSVVTTLAPIMQGFFTERLAQRRASEHTVAAYRDAFRLLLAYAQQHLGRPPSVLDLADIDADLVGGFLDHLEAHRSNSITTRNARLAAIHSLFTYAALRCPEHALLIQRVLAIPHKRSDSTNVCFLTRAEVDALLAVPDQSTPLGRRDHLLLLVGIQTGLRVSELTSLSCGDAELGTGAHLRCTGKGRKQRCTPLTRPTARLLHRWITDRRAAPGDPLFPNRTGGHLSRDAVADLLGKYVPAAAAACPTLASKSVTPHTMRHTTAMTLLHAGVDTSTIALWLGHASTKATDVYLHADMAMKEKALARTAPPAQHSKRYHPTDRLLTFLEQL